MDDLVFFFLSVRWMWLVCGVISNKSQLMHYKEKVDKQIFIGVFTLEMWIKRIWNCRRRTGQSFKEISIAPDTERAPGSIRPKGEMFWIVLSNSSEYRLVWRFLKSSCTLWRVQTFLTRLDYIQSTHRHNLTQICLFLIDMNKKKNWISLFH